MLNSIYARNTDALPAAAIARPQTCDVAIIGGGLTGVTAALHLAEHGYDVVLLEAETVGSGGSGRNGGPNLQLRGIERCQWIPTLTLFEETTPTLAPRPRRIS